jgi:hypothetical protein
MNLIKRITKNVLDATFHLVNLKKPAGVIHNLKKRQDERSSLG